MKKQKTEWLKKLDDIQKRFNVSINDALYEVRETKKEFNNNA